MSRLLVDPQPVHRPQLKIHPDAFCCISGLTGLFLRPVSSVCKWVWSCLFFLSTQSRPVCKWVWSCLFFLSTQSRSVCKWVWSCLFFLSTQSRSVCKWVWSCLFFCLLKVVLSGSQSGAVCFFCLLWVGLSVSQSGAVLSVLPILSVLSVRRGLWARCRSTRSRLARPRMPRSRHGVVVRGGGAGSKFTWDLSGPESWVVGRI